VTAQKNTTRESVWRQLRKVRARPNSGAWLSGGVCAHLLLLVGAIGVVAGGSAGAQFGGVHGRRRSLGGDLLGSSVSTSLTPDARGERAPIGS
jgi:hypothetical protein